MSGSSGAFRARAGGRCQGRSGGTKTRGSGDVRVGLAAAAGTDPGGDRGGYERELVAVMLAELGLRQEKADESHAHQEV